MDLSIPIVAIVIGIPAFIAFMALVIGHTRKLEELKIREKELETRGSDAELGPEVDALRDDVADIQERLDLAERLLAAGRAPKNDRGG